MLLAFEIAIIFGGALPPRPPLQIIGGARALPAPPLPTLH